MSIICYTGLPGDGKSYSAVENVVIPALKAKRHVAHNLMLNLAALNVVCGYDVAGHLHQLDRDDTPQALIDKCPPGAVIVIDEVWRYWPAGTKANEVPKEELKFFKEHRHRVGADDLATEILIIDQDPLTGVPAFLRALIELTYVHTKHSALGSKTRFRVDVYTRAQSAQKPSKGALLRSLQGRYKPEVWNCYISHTQATKIGEVGLEKAVDGRANLLKGWTIRSAVIALFILPLALWWASGAVQGMATGGGTKKPPASKPAPSTVAPATATQSIQTTSLPLAQPAKPPVAADEPSVAKASQPSTVWRILGVIERAPLGEGIGEGIALVASATGRRRLDLKQHCRYDANAVDWVCSIDGIEVTYWSGSRLGGDLNAAVVPGTADGSNQPKQLSN